MRQIVDAAARRQRFHTADEIAEHIGTSRRSIYRYIAQGTPPKLNKSVHRNLLRLAAELGVTKSDESIAGVML